MSTCPQHYRASPILIAFFRGRPSLYKPRLDPIVAPGQFSGHVHSFGGASTIYSDLTYDRLRSSNCTTSDMADDKSVSSADWPWSHLLNPF